MYYCPMNDTKSKIIHIAENLIRTRGYNGFSYKDISSELNIKNAAVHYHFPTKVELGIAVIQHTRHDFEVKFKKSHFDGNNKERLKQFIDLYSKSNKRGIVCFMGALGPSYDHLHPKIQDELTQASKEIRDWLCIILEEGRMSGEFHFKGTVKSNADLIITSLMASLILNKVTKEDVFSNSVDQILTTI